MARQRRRNVRSVDVYAMDDAPLTRAFAGGCWALAELYSVTLARTDDPIKATVSWIRIFVDRRIRPGAPSRIEEEPPDGYGFSDGMRCAVDPDILAAAPADRPRRYLEWLHARMLELARSRDWDESVLHRAYQDSLDADLTLVSASPPKSSPGRRHRAVLSLRITGDGSGSVTVSIMDRGGVEVGRTASAQACGLDDFRKLVRQMSWTDQVTVATDDGHRTFGVPGILRITARVGEFADIPSLRDPGLFREYARRLELEHPTPELSEPGIPQDDPENVEYEPDELPVRRMTLIGGGPVGEPNGIVRAWDRALAELLGDLDAQPAWRSWWESSGQPPCMIQYYTDEPAHRIRIRRLATEVRVRLERPRETGDPVAEARQDAEAVIEALRVRFALPPPPALGHQVS